VRNNGRSPNGGLIQASDGHLYGVTTQAGEFGYGIVYRLTLDGEFTLLHSFDWKDGIEPSTALVQATDGRLYGSTPSGSHRNTGDAPMDGPLRWQTRSPATWHERSPRARFSCKQRHRKGSFPPAQPDRRF
jgi:uncharacterized repeat protein (TIGR03803 family)